MLDTLNPDHDKDTLHAMWSNRPQVAKRGANFVVIGTEYGYVRTSGGDWRTWKSASGARKFIKRQEG